jgi:hypothetical protein
VVAEDTLSLAHELEVNLPGTKAAFRSGLLNQRKAPKAPKCRHDHRLKQHPRWSAGQLPDGSVRWTTPAGRQYTTEPTRYPI